MSNPPLPASTAHPCYLVSVVVRQVDKVGKSAAVTIVRSLIKATAQRVEATAKRVGVKPTSLEDSSSSGDTNSSLWIALAGFFGFSSKW